jgi:hypothetical protein
MKVEVHDAPVIAAHRAATAGFIHERALQLLLAARYRLSHASLAAPSLSTSATELVMELNPPVVLAEPNLRRAFGGRRPPGSIDQWVRGIRPSAHEHMFVESPDGPPATVTT